MNRHALSSLEYPRVKEAVFSFLKSAAGQRMWDQWGPSADHAKVDRMIEETAQMKAFIEEKGEIDLTDLIFPDEILKKSKPEGACLTPREVTAVRMICRLNRLCRTRLVSLPSRFELISGLARGLPVLSNLEKKIGGALDEDAEFLDTASQNLSRIIKEKGSAKTEVHSLYKDLLSRYSREGIFQDDIITTRGGRYVLMVKSQAKGRMPGIIHDQTESGAAVYLEPKNAVGINNKLSELASEEKNEKRKILRGLTDIVRINEEAVLMTVSILGSLDLMQARALHGLQKGYVRPMLNTSGKLKLSRARHPLLEKVLGDAVVPLELLVESNQRALIITGPNTGGKTVALKTVGLLCLMAQSGLFIPAEEGTTMPFFTNLFADIGDEQSLEQNLSTFSAHVRNISEAVREADENSLVILDELAAGTDPTEGAPLAMAIIENLIKRGSLILSSTHQGSLVAFADDTSGALNASMEFDSGTLRPTFRMIIGVPGKSNAREVARQMDIPEEIINRSLELQPEAEKGIYRLVEDLHRRRRKMEATVAELSSRKMKLSSLIRTKEDEIEKLRKRKEKILSEARERALKTLSKAKKEISEIISRTPSIGGTAHRQLHSLGKKVEHSLPQARIKSARPLKKEPKIGQEVRLASVAAEGKVVDFNADKKIARIEVQGKIIELPAEYLEEAEHSTPRKKGKDETGRYVIGVDEITSSRLDIRGLRSDEALNVVTKFLDQAWLKGLESVEILHGKGSGRLKEACAKFISEHPGVCDFGPASNSRGGYGVTLIKFK